MRKKLGISFIVGLAIIIAGFVLISMYEGSGSAWSKEVPEGLELILHAGVVICLLSGILIGAFNKLEK